MDKRKSERVQFFQLPSDDDWMPIWVFQRARPDTVPGLLLDVSAEGVQLLTGKSSLMESDTYQLIVHEEEASRASFLTLHVRRLWSKAEGALYMRNGFALEGSTERAMAAEKLLACRPSGRRWLRCELGRPDGDAASQSSGANAIPVFEEVV